MPDIIIGPQITSDPPGWLDALGASPSVPSQEEIDVEREIAADPVPLFSIVDGLMPKVYGISPSDLALYRRMKTHYLSAPGGASVRRNSRKLRHVVEGAWVQNTGRKPPNGLLLVSFLQILRSCERALTYRGAL